MAKETKVGLLIGLALILLVGIILSDLVSGPEPGATAQDQAAGFGPQAQHGIYAEPDTPAPTAHHPRSADRPTVLNRGNPAPVPNAFQTQPAFGQGPASHRTASPDPVRILPSPQPEADLAPRLGPPPSRRPDLPETQTLEAATPRTAELPQAWRVDRAVAAATPTTPAPTPTRDPAVSATPDDGSFFIPPPVADRGSDRFHVVSLRDSLAAVARKHYGDPAYATGLAKANPGRVAFGGTLHPGDRLVLPPLDSPFFATATPTARESLPPAPPQRAPAPAPAPGPAPEPIDTLTVAANDTLSGLAARHLGSAQRWDELLAANRNVLERPEALREGMVLRLPTTSTPAAPAATPTPISPPAGPKTYTVKAGDNLTRIAASTLGNGQRWDEIFAANRNLLDNPQSIRVGMTLVLPGQTATATATPAPPTPSAPAAGSPAPTGPRTYTVKAGDNLTRIAASTLGNGQRWDEIFAANRATLDAPESIRVGQVLILP